MKKIMSRRKQSNPKPLLKREDEELSEEQQQQQQQNSEGGEEMNSSRPSSQNDTDRVSPSPTPSNCSSTPNSHEGDLEDGNTAVGDIKIEIMDRKCSDSEKEENSKSPIINFQHHLPLLRLNTVLAADPATNPDAKDLKNITVANEENFDKNEKEYLQPERIIEKPENITIPINVDLPPRLPVFMCGPCGIRFSSASTLEAHQTYYCSHRKDADENGGKNSSNDPNSTEPPNKSVKTGKQYACTQCSYSADKKVSLNRHMRMHQSSPTPSSTTSNGDDATSQLQLQITAQALQQPQPQIDRYCSDCDIRFSSTKTYRAHKQHYCSSRHREGQPNNVTTPKPTATQKSGSQSPTEVAKTPPVIVQPQPQPFLALPTNPIIIIPYSLIRGASVLPGPISSLAPNVSNSESACFIFQNGALQPIAFSLASTSQPQHQPNAQSRVQTPSVANVNDNSSNSNSTGEVLKAANKKEVAGKETSTPLDLSIRRMSPGISLRERSLSLSSAMSAEHLKMDFDSMMEGKENLSVSGDSVTPEQIVCAPSLPGSPPLTPSPKRRSNSPRGSRSISMSPLSLASLQQHQQQLLQMRPLLPADIALRLSDPSLSINLNLLQQPQLSMKQGLELALRLSSNANCNHSDASPKQPQMSPLLNKLNSPTPNNSSAASVVIPSAPQIFVKQGDSKCKECNIVFCKYENYLAHKKHYCSARNLEDGENTKVSPPISPKSTSPSTPGGTSNSTRGGSSGTTVAYQQLICAACGIKFTSLDNLSAHQMYYCPKRVDLQVQQSSTPQKERCSKCKSVHETGQPCTVAGAGAYKCPICEVISPNSTEARRHMDTHGGVKAFRCTICRYKGNTLRGMRTHIRMHFDKKTNDFNEENYITCILEEDGIEIPPAAAVASVTAVANQTNSASPQLLAQTPDNLPQQMHYCDMCNYSSTYKGNVVRHIRLVHTQNRTPSNSPMIGEGGESLVHNGDGNLTPGPRSTHTPIPVNNNLIKTEPAENKGDENDVDVDVVMDEPETIIKTEINDVASPLSSPILSHSLNQSQIKFKSQTKSAKPPSPPALPNAINTDISLLTHSGPRYCESCDISFTYLNTFIAHKKFYCKNNPTDATGGAVNNANSATSGSPNNNNVVVTRATETSVL